MSLERRGALVRAVWLAALLSLVGGLLGCAAEPSADLLRLVDVAPRQLEVGDTVEILGSDLPSGNVQHATVVFRGKVLRPGAPPRAIEEVVRDAKPSPDRVSLTFSEQLQTAFCGEGDEAGHTTFSGEVIVRFAPTVEGALGVQGTIENVTLDLRGPPVRRSIEEARTARGQDAATFLGLTLEGHPDLAEGLRVTAVAEGSPAARAGLETGDLLLRFDGVTVLELADVAPRHGGRLAEATVRRGDQELVRSLEVSGFEAEPVPDDILAAVVILAILGSFLLLSASPAARVLTWIERRLLLRVMNGRRASARASWLATLGALVRSGRRRGLAPYVIFAVVTASFALMPLGRRLLSAELDVGLLYVIALSSLVVLGLLTGGTRWTPWSALRAALQLLGSQLPALTAVACVLVVTGSLQMHDVIGAQAGTGESLLGRGGWPWFWFVFRHPGNLLLCGLFFATATLESQRDELPGAEGKGASRASARALLFLFADWLHVFVSCGLATALFLGGWLVPGVSVEELDGSFGWQALGTVLFLAKAWALVIAVIATRRTLPRLRADQLIRVAWRWLVPLAALGAGATALWIMGTRRGDEPLVPAAVQVAVGAFTFGACALVASHLAARLRRQLAERAPLHLNPFL